MSDQRNEFQPCPACYGSGRSRRGGPCHSCRSTGLVKGAQAFGAGLSAVGSALIAIFWSAVAFAVLALIIVAALQS